jgi:hypothetical protein
MLINIPIPDNAKCLLKNGDKVDIGTPYLEYKTTSSVSIPIAKKLGISPTSIFKHIKKFVGEPLKKGDIVASKKGLFTSVKIMSEYDGVLKEIDHNEGIFIIDIDDGTNKKDLSYFKGEVETINKKEIQIKVKSAKEYPLKQSTGNFGGKTIYITNIKSIEINTDCDNSICVAESISTYVQSKTEALGIHGYVTLNKLPEETELPNVLLKQIDHMKKIFELKLPYCIIDEKKGIIVFYQ